ncbi:DUF5134 domain-containing protein [Amycolatopsis sp. NPDC004368]
MIADPLLRWVVTALFVLSAAACAYRLTGGLSFTAVVGIAMHALMAVAMVRMAWPGEGIGGVTVFFLLAAVWFGVVAARRNHRRVNAYHVLTMLAMAWMSRPHQGSMPGMVMSDPTMPGMTGPHDTVGLTAGLDWVLAIGFAAAGVWWLWRLVARSLTAPLPTGHTQADLATQAMTAAGTAVMFAVLL